MSDKDIVKHDAAMRLAKSYLINRGWSYTGRFPHSWRDPESKFPADVDEALYDIADAVAIQNKRDGHAETAEPQITARAVMETIERADALYAEVGLEVLAPERMAVARVKQMLKDEIALANGHRRAGLLGTRKKDTTSHAKDR